MEELSKWFNDEPPCLQMLSKLTLLIFYFLWGANSNVLGCIYFWAKIQWHYGPIQTQPYFSVN